MRSGLDIKNRKRPKKTPRASLRSLGNAANRMLQLQEAIAKMAPEVEAVSEDYADSLLKSLDSSPRFKKALNALAVQHKGIDTAIIVKVKDAVAAVLAEYNVV